MFILSLMLFASGHGLAAQAGGGQAGGGQAGGGQAPAAQRARPLPSISERTDGFQRQDGFFPLYWDDATGTLYLEIPRLNQEVLWVSGLSAGLGSNDIGSTARSSAASGWCGSSASARAS
jgi:hypothetical protein